MKNCEHKYKVHNRSATQVLYDVRRALVENNPLAALSEIEYYMGQERAQGEVDRAIEFLKSEACQACEYEETKGE
jgi:hypothetical protein